MRSPSKSDGENDRRKTERRGTVKSGERRSEPMRAATGDRREFEQRNVGTAMVDALEDILKWERASERAIKVAADTSTASLDATPS